MSLRFPLESRHCSMVRISLAPQTTTYCWIEFAGRWSYAESRAFRVSVTMTVSFHANCVAIDDMDDFWLVAFADEKFGTRQYLMLQRSYEDDEQDIQLGMNTYHVERDDQGFSCYGGVKHFEL